MSSSDALLASRIANQHLGAPRLADPAQLVAHLGAVQSQDYAAAKWAVGLRVLHATEASVEQAFNAGAILRTHVLRPTWHFVTPADVRWMLALTAPRIKAGMARSTNFDEGLLARCFEVITRTLEGGQSRTRVEIGVALARAGISLNPSQLAHLMGRAELDALVISGPLHGKQHTYALFAERVAAARPLERDEALAELTWRYFNSHGPALVADCSWWSGLSMTDVKRGLELNRHRLQSRTLDARTYWSSAFESAAPETLVHLLSNFDEYTVAYRVRELYFDPELNRTGNPREDIPFGNVIVARGKVAGRWKRATNEACWWIEPSRQLRSGLERATRRYAEFRAAAGVEGSYSGAAGLPGIL